MQLLSNRVLNLEESATLAMSAKSRALTEKGIHIVNLSLGEPDFNTPDFIKAAAKNAIDQNFSKYPPVAGFKDLREAISAKFQRDNGLQYAPEQIVVSTGAKQSIMNVMLAMLNEGDEVLMPAPYWVSYYEMVRFSGGIPVVIPSDISTDFKVSAENLEKYITAKTKLLIFSSPCNPSGMAYTRDELKHLAEMLQKYPDIYVVSDEIYEHINFSGKSTSIGALPGMIDKTITVNGVSKGFAMTGWRIGYLGAPKAIADACTKIQGQFTSGASSISQKATLAAVNANPNETLHMREAFQKRRDLVKQLLDKIPGFKTNLPEGAFYLFPDVSALFGKSFQGKVMENSDDLAMYFLEIAHVATVGGTAFGNPNNLRISYAASEADLTEACNRLNNAVLKLQ